MSPMKSLFKKVDLFFVLPAKEIGDGA